MVLKAGDQVGIYRVERQIGTGGMATVYSAVHEKLDRKVALKVMHPNLLEDANFKARFDREAKIIARLDHPNIVPVYDFSEHNGQPYLVMKIIEGQTLKRRLRAGALPLDEIKRIMHAVAGALDYAHRQGILHRDIKPSNIILDEQGTPYLTDFGLARVAQSGETTLSTDIMLGTPYYVSPEQAQSSGEIDGRADIYSLGVVLYELLVGRVPFMADTPYSTVHDHIYKTPPPPSTLNPEITPEVEAVVMRALAKDPADRYQTAGDLVQAFEAALDESHLVQLDPQRRMIDPETRRPRSEQTTTPLPHDKHDRARPRVRRSDEDWEESLEKVGKNLERFGEEFARKAEEWGTSVAAWFEDQEDENKARKSKRDGSGEYDDEEAEERRIRKFVEKRSEERTGLIIHLLIYLFVNAVIIQSPIVAFFWGIGMFAHIADYWNKYGPGRDSHERAVQREIERERARRMGYGVSRKRKNETLFDDEEDDEAPRVRLTRDGELTDSTLRDLTDEEIERRKRR